MLKLIYLIRKISPCVCHKDNNKLNNSVDNLYWGTQKENLEQMIKDGRSLKGRRNPMWKNHYNSGYGRYGEKATASKLLNKDRISIVLGYKYRYFIQKIQSIKSLY